MARITRKGPLRQVIGYVGIQTLGIRYLRTHELLECGHSQRAVQDIYGETYAQRRRCSKCSNQAPVMPELALLVKAWEASPKSELIRSPDPMNTGFQNIED